MFHAYVLKYTHITMSVILSLHLIVLINSIYIFLTHINFFRCLCSFTFLRNSSFLVPMSKGPRGRTVFCSLKSIQERNHSSNQVSVLMSCLNHLTIHRLPLRTISIFIWLLEYNKISDLVRHREKNCLQ